MYRRNNLSSCRSIICFLLFLFRRASDYCYDTDEACHRETWIRQRAYTRARISTSTTTVLIRSNKTTTGAVAAITMRRYRVCWRNNDSINNNNNNTRLRRGLSGGRSVVKTAGEIGNFLITHRYTRRSASLLYRVRASLRSIVRLGDDGDEQWKQQRWRWRFASLSADVIIIIICSSGTWHIVFRTSINTRLTRNNNVLCEHVVRSYG